MARDQLKCDDNVKTHLDNCLQCLNCQKVCPSQVNYSEIIHQGQQYTFKNSQKIVSLGTLTLGNRLIDYLLTNGIFKQIYFKLFNSMSKIGLLKPCIKLAKGLSIRSAYYLPEVPFHSNKSLLKNQSQVIETEIHQRINLFAGCGNSLFEPQLLKKLIPLLNKMGIYINEINSDSCCGAIFQRNGDSRALEKITDLNQKQYKHSAFPLLSLTSTCTAQLQKNIAHSYDICTYLGDTEYARFQSLQFKPLREKVILHAACSLRNQLFEQDFPEKLLSHIPHITLLKLLSNGCCGAAGNYMLEHPKMADKIVQPYLDSIIESGAKILLTTNIGCGLHIRAQLEKLNYNIEVKHPISLLSEQLNLENAVDFVARST